MEYALTLDTVTKTFGDLRAVDEVSLAVPRGTIYGFLGPNGAGKSTTIKLLMGMLRPAKGQISVLGLRTPEQLPRILADVGYVPERPHLYPFLPVEAAVAYHAAFFPTFDMPYALELLDQFNLPRRRAVRALSKGEAGKLHMLLVLAQRPRLLVLDEPTDGLDPVVRRDVLTALLDFCSQGSTTVFISSHLVHELERICDWVGVVDKGRLVAELPMHAFKNGIKRLRVQHAPSLIGDTPFVVLLREQTTYDEVWTVRGWQPPMAQWFEGCGAELKQVVDLDLEEGFVELLRASRTPAA
jgi:ABC-2 type transport system ATP-binding protein